MSCWKKGETIPFRLIIGGMVALASVIMAIIRSNMSILILAMTKNPYNATDELPDYGFRYAWSTYEQSLVLGSYFWGNTIICSIAGVCADRYGARNILVVSFIFATVLSVLTPVAVFLWQAILIRFLLGIAMGTVFPSLHCLIGMWIPANEKGIFLSLMNCTGIGVIVSWSISGHVVEQFGWMYAFYMAAIISAMFTAFLLIFVQDSPIMKLPADFIVTKSRTVSNTTKTKPWPPFGSIFTSIPFWALVLFHFGNMCGFFLLLTSVPKYMSEVHSFSITSIGILASLPYIFVVPSGILFGVIGDCLMKREIMSTNAIRKWFSIFSHFIPGCLLACITVVGNKPYTCLALITVALCLNGSVAVTSVQNAHDLAPNFVSTVFGLVSIAASTAGYLSPFLVAYFTKEKSTEEEWQKIFFVGAALLIGCNIIFILFGSGHIQEWNKIPNKQTSNKHLNTIEPVEDTAFFNKS